MRRDPTSEKSDLDNFKMVLFGNGYPEEFLLFVCNFNMALEVSGTFKSGAKIQYIFTLVHGEILHRFDVLSAEVEGATPVTLASIVLVLVTYFFLLMRCPIKKLSMRCRMRSTRGLKLRRYTTHLVDINKYLAVLSGAKISDKN